MSQPHPLLPSEEGMVLITSPICPWLISGSRISMDKARPKFTDSRLVPESLFVSCILLDKGGYTRKCLWNQNNTSSNSPRLLPFPLNLS